MKLGFIGLGRMGSGICANLLRAGHELVVFDPLESALAPVLAAGAEAAAGVGDVAGAVDVLFTCLPGPPEIEQAILGRDGAADRLRPGAVLIDHSTSAPALARRIGAVLGERGVSMLDAPVSGGQAQAAAGELTIIVGGERAVYEAQRPLLEPAARTIVHVGPLGSGLVAKLLNNLLLFDGVAAVCETLMVAARAGLDLRRFVEVVSNSSGDSVAFRSLAARALDGDYEPKASLDLAFKDAHLALELADELGVPTPAGAGTLNLIRTGQAMGFGALDPTALMRVYESIVGRSVRVEPDHAATEPDQRNV